MRYEVDDVVKCISNKSTMDIGTYGVIEEINNNEGSIVTVEIAARVGNIGSFSATMRTSDLVKVGKLF